MYCILVPESQHEGSAPSIGSRSVIQEMISLLGDF